MRNEHAVAADDSGAVYGGVIFADSSPRKVNAENVDPIFANTALRRVGVFQDHSFDQINELARQCRLDAVQLHGDESPQLIPQLIDKLGPNVEFWKAIAVHQYDALAPVWLEAGASRLVVDNHRGAQKGGTGQAFDWSRLPAENRDRVILAGGIGVDNIRQAVETGCSGIDMNSRLETEPGIKSVDLVREAFRIIRDYRAVDASIAQATSPSSEE